MKIFAFAFTTIYAFDLRAPAQESVFTLQCTQRLEKKDVYLGTTISVDYTNEDDFVITVDQNKLAWWPVSRNGKPGRFLVKLAHIDDDTILLSKYDGGYEEIDRNRGSFYSYHRIYQRSNADGSNDNTSYLRFVITGSCEKKDLQNIPADADFPGKKKLF